MKTSSFFRRRAVAASILAGLCALAFAGPALAGPPPSRFVHRHEIPTYLHHRHDHIERTRYLAYPHSRFVMAYGSGYAGRGYYFGPPNSPYYYQTPGVLYYSRRELVPTAYRNSLGHGNSTITAVQDTLARLGYYGGVIDGKLGPETRSAIAHYQRERGMVVTGTANAAVLYALDL